MAIAELNANPDAWQPLLVAARHGMATLVYSSHKTAHNNAGALEEFLKYHLHVKRTSLRGAAGIAWFQSTGIRRSI